MPRVLAVFQRAAGREPREIATDTVWQRQMRRDRRQRRELEAREGQFSFRRMRCGRFVVCEREIGRHQLRAVGGAKAERLGENLAMPAVVFPPDASAQIIELERRQIGCKPCIDVGEREIGSDVARLALRHLGPQA